MKKVFLMITLMLGCMTVFAQKIDKNEAKQLKAFLSQPAEKDATNAAALKVTDLNNIAGIEGVKVENGHVTSIEWGDKHLAGTLDVSGFTALKKLDVSRNKLTGLDASGSTALSELNASRNQLASADVSGCSSLYKLSLNRNRMTEIELGDLPLIENINVANNYFVSLDVSNSATLKTLNCQGNHLENLTVIILLSGQRRKLGGLYVEFGRSATHSHQLAADCNLRHLSHAIGHDRIYHTEVHAAFTSGHSIEYQRLSVGSGYSGHEYSFRRIENLVTAGAEADCDVAVVVGHSRSRIEVGNYFGFGPFGIYRVVLNGHRRCAAGSCMTRKLVDWSRHGAHFHYAAVNRVYKQVGRGICCQGGGQGCAAYVCAAVMARHKVLVFFHCVD